jgi:hypothetical protein
MRRWAALYGMVWLLFVEIWLSLTPIAPPVPLYLHELLGVAIVAVAYVNAEGLRATAAPGRIKRIARATFQLSILMAVLGVLLFLGLGSGWEILFGVTVLGLLLFFHFVNAMAMITQAAAAAIAYDMWEDREFERGSPEGVVPPPPPPTSAPARSG